MMAKSHPKKNDDNNTSLMFLTAKGPMFISKDDIECSRANSQKIKGKKKHTHTHKIQNKRVSGIKSGGKVTLA